MAGEQSVDLSHFPEYLEWAHARTLQMLRGMPNHTSVSIFAHLLGAELVWAARVTGDAPPCPVWPEWTLQECAEVIGRSVGCYRGILGHFQGDRVINYRNSKGESFASTEGDILLHVFAHGAYHRGQISQEVRRARVELLDTDYILFRR